MGWCILRLWRKDLFSVTYVVERGGERRLLRLALQSPDSSEGYRLERYLEREVGALRNVRHPSLLRIHGDGRWPDPSHGFRYLMTDPVEGPNLLVWMLRRDATMSRLATVALQIMEAIAAVRGKGFNPTIRLESIFIREVDDRPLLGDLCLTSCPGNRHPSPKEVPAAGAVVPAGLDVLLAWANVGSLNESGANRGASDA
jgi:serine/threonine protein kinase